MEEKTSSSFSTMTGMRPENFWTASRMNTKTSVAANSFWSDRNSARTGMILGATSGNWGKYKQATRLGINWIQDPGIWKWSEQNWPWHSIDEGFEQGVGGTCPSHHVPRNCVFYQLLYVERARPHWLSWSLASQEPSWASSDVLPSPVRQEFEEYPWPCPRAPFHEQWLHGVEKAAPVQWVSRYCHFPWWLVRCSKWLRPTSNTNLNSLKSNETRERWQWIDIRMTHPYFTLTFIAEGAVERVTRVPAASYRTAELVEARRL